MDNLNTDVTTSLDTVSIVHKWKVTGIEHLQYMKERILSPVLSHKNMDFRKYHIYIQYSPECKTICVKSRRNFARYRNSQEHYHCYTSIGLLFYENITFATLLNIVYIFQDHTMEVTINSATMWNSCGMVEIPVCNCDDAVQSVKILTCHLSYVTCLTKSLNLCACYKEKKEPLVNQTKDNTVMLKDNRELFKIEPKDYLHAIYEDPDFSDMTINVKEESFYIHTSILSYYPYFKDLILETKSRGDKHIYIQDIEPYLFKYILCYIYTGVDENLKSVKYQILPIVKKFGLHTLEEKYIRMLKDELSIDSLISTLNTATEINAKDLLSDIKTFVIKHMSTISKRNEYKELKQYYPDFLIQVLHSIMTS